MPAPKRWVRDVFCSLDHSKAGGGEEMQHKAADGKLDQGVCASREKPVTACGYRITSQCGRA